MIRERGAQRMFEPIFLAHMRAAQLELGNLEAGRAAAQEGMSLMRETKGASCPLGYAVLLERTGAPLRGRVARVARAAGRS